MAAPAEERVISLESLSPKRLKPKIKEDLTA